MIELLAIGGAVAGALATGMYIGRSKAEPVDPEGCNGHHWEDREPLIDPIPVDGEHPYGSIRRLETRIDSKGVRLRVDAQKTCEDCNETRETQMQVGRVPFEAFRDEDEE